MTNPRSYPTGEGDNHPDYTDWNNMVAFATALNNLGLDWTTIEAYLTGLTASGYIREPFSYIIRTNGPYYEATTGYGQLAYGGSGDEGGIDGTDAAAVIQETWDNTPQGGKFFIRAGTYPIETKLDFYTAAGNGRRTVEGEGWGTILRANAALTSLIDLSGAITSERMVLKNMQVDADSKCDYCFFTDYYGGMYVRLEDIWARRANTAEWHSEDTGSLRFLDCSFNYTNGTYDMEIDGGTDIYSIHSAIRKLHVEECDWHMQGGNCWYVNIGDMQEYSPTFDHVWFENPVSAGFYIIVGSDAAGMVDRAAIRNCVFNRYGSAFDGAVKVDYASNTLLANNSYSAAGALATHPTKYIDITSNAVDTVIVGWTKDYAIAKLSNASTSTTIVGGSGFHAEGTSTGTGAEQTIAHGLLGTPTKLILYDIEEDAGPYRSSAVDATNIYVTAGNGLDWGWEASFVP